MYSVYVINHQLSLMIKLSLGLNLTNITTLALCFFISLFYFSFSFLFFILFPSHGVFISCSAQHDKYFGSAKIGRGDCLSKHHPLWHRLQPQHRHEHHPVVLLPRCLRLLDVYHGSESYPRFLSPQRYVRGINKPDKTKKNNFDNGQVSSCGIVLEN